MDFMVRFILFLLCIMPSVYGENKILHCLAKEEEILHKFHETGPVYKLNQYLIDHIVAAPHILFKEKYVHDICHNSDFSPSVNLLRVILVKGKELYEFSGDKYGKALQKSTIDSFLETIPHTFFSYLSWIQKLTPTHDCLSNHVKYLDYFQTRFQYVEEELSGEILTIDKDKIYPLFESLKNLDSIIKKCEASLKKP